MRIDLSGIVPGRFFSVIQVNFLLNNSRAGADNNKCSGRWDDLCGLFPC